MASKVVKLVPRRSDAVPRPCPAPLSRAPSSPRRRPMTIAEPRMDRMVASVEHVFRWFMSGDWEQHHLDPGVADFTFGNPQELPLPGLVDALRSNAIPRDKDWFAYKMS